MRKPKVTTEGINSKSADILAPLGDVQQGVDELLAAMLIENWGAWHELRGDRPYWSRYHLPYEVF